MRDQWTTNAKGRKVLIRAKTIIPGVCAVLRCRNAPRANQGQLICNTCHVAEVRANNPLWAEWHDKAHRHTRRGIRGKDRPCCTFEEWKQFHATRPSPDHVVDRKDPLGGYTLDNMQWLTYAENAAKGATFDKAAYAEHKRRQATPEVLVDETPDPDREFHEAVARLALDTPDQFQTCTGLCASPEPETPTFTPTDNEPF